MLAVERDPAVQPELRGFDTPYPHPQLSALLFPAGFLPQKAQLSADHGFRASPRWGHPADLVAYQVDLDCLLEVPIIYDGSWP